MRVLQGLRLLGVSFAAACGGTTSDVPEGPDAGVEVDATQGADASTVSKACSIKTGFAAVPAVLHEPDGAVKATIQTDANGVAAWSDCPEGALVSYAKYSVADGWRGVTIAGVRPGDHLEVMLDDSDPVTTGKVNVPSDAADVTMVRAWAGGECSIGSAEGATASVVVTRGCRGDNGTMLPVLATGKINGVSVYSHSAGASVVVGGDTVVTDMSGWMTGPQIALTATNASTSQLTLEMQPMWNGVPYGGVSQLVNVANNMASHNMSLPPSAFTNVRRVGVSTTGIVRRGITRTTNQLGATFDVGFLLPEVTAITVDNTTPARPSYTVGGALTATDLGIIHSQWMTNNVEVSWRLIYPSATTSSIKFPALPAELAGATPNAAVASFAVAVDITGSTFAEILTRGYRFDEFLHGCADLPDGAECWFSSRSAV